MWQAALRELRHPAVRDLAALLTMPPPWADAAEIAPGRLLGPQGWPQLLALDADPAALDVWLAATLVRRLGFHAERLWRFWFQSAPHIELVAANLTVQDGRRTVGEFDFLLRVDGEPLHLETASKYYLDVDGHAVGPSLRDARWRKQARLQQQLQLSTHPAACLPAGFTPTAAYCRISGMHFVAAANWPDRPVEAWCGWWQRQPLPWPRQSADSRWCVLPRLRWLSPARLPASSLLDEDTMRAHLQTCDTPQLLAEMLPMGQGEDWQEVARGFVVPAAWPQEALLAELLRDAP